MTLLTWNTANFITVTLMIGLMFLIFMFVGKAVHTHAQAA